MALKCSNFLAIFYVFKIFGLPYFLAERTEFKVDLLWMCPLNSFYFINTIFALKSYTIDYVNDSQVGKLLDYLVMFFGIFHIFINLFSNLKFQKPIKDILYDLYNNSSKKSHSKCKIETVLLILFIIVIFSIDYIISITQINGITFLNYFSFVFDYLIFSFFKCYAIYSNIRELEMQFAKINNLYCELCNMDSKKEVIRICLVLSFNHMKWYQVAKNYNYMTSLPILSQITFSFYNASLDIMYVARIVFTEFGNTWPTELNIMVTYLAVYSVIPIFVLVIGCNNLCKQVINLLLYNT